jgi:peptidoglycan/LPS O-acetylase OafA/YrhL
MGDMTAVHRVRGPSAAFGARIEAVPAGRRSATGSAGPGRPASGAPADPPDRRIGVLDGWRTVSVALVIVNHFALYSSARLDRDTWGFLDHWGRTGVFVFFLLSGYVICRGFLRERERRGRVSIRAFYVRRFFRILPPLWLYLATVTALAAAGWVAYDLSYLPRALAFTCNVGIDLHRCGGQVVEHLWSLSVEEQFYLLFPLLLLGVGPVNRVAFAVGAILLPLAVIGSYALHAGRVGAFLAQFVCIQFGVVCALFEREIVGALRRAPAILPALAFGALMAAATLASPGRGWAVVSVLLMPPLILLMVMGTVALPGSSLGRLLDTGPFRSVGGVSYGVYLWQQLALLPHPRVGPLGNLLALCAAVALAYLLFHAVERPLIGFAADWSERLRQDGSGGAGSLGSH